MEEIDLENTEIPTEQLPGMDIDDIEIVEAKQTIDASKYEGARVKVAKVETQWDDSHYINGEYDANKTVKALMVYVETEPLDQIPQSDGSTRPFVVRQRFSLQQDTLTGKWVISKHPKAKLWAFMRKVGAPTLKDIVGKIVTITSEPSKAPGDDRRYSKIVC